MRFLRPPSIKVLSSFGFALVGQEVQVRLCDIKLGILEIARSVIGVVSTEMVRLSGARFATLGSPWATLAASTGHFHRARLHHTGVLRCALMGRGQPTGDQLQDCGVAPFG
jgi:hypothetical protein